MSNARNIALYDRLGHRLRARLLANGHIQLSEHIHRYTYARVNQRGQIELYDDSGNFSYATLENDSEDAEEVDLLRFAPRRDPAQFEPLVASTALLPK